MAILTVGSGQQYATLSAAIGASHDGDTIDVQAGTYTDDFSTVTTNITIQGIGGLAVFKQSSTGVIPNGKAILTTDANVTIDHIAFEGATVPDNNGAGIRDESGNLVVTNCLFSGNQDGILTGGNSAYTLTVKSSEFAYNGAGDGQSHNLYVGAIASADIEDNYFHNAIVGHEIKSRALSTTIANNRIYSGPGGTNSYSIDLPDGGNALVFNNTIQKGPTSQNPIFIHYGGEGGPYSGSSLLVAGNTVVNDEASPSALLLYNQTSVVATIGGDSVYKLTLSQIALGPAKVSDITTLSVEPTLDTSSPIAPVACFVAGTRIGTPDGPRAIETLREGDLVTTMSGAARAIVWAGSRSIHVASHPRPDAVRPIRVDAHAFGEGLPARDLFLSPDHAVFAEGVLIPIKHLVNGTTVRPVARRVVAYHHIELERHDAVLAEGLAAETFLDIGGRAAGDAREILPLGPRIRSVANHGTAVWEAAGYAPLMAAGAEVDRARAVLRARAKAARLDRAA